MKSINASACIKPLVKDLLPPERPSEQDRFYSASFAQPQDPEQGSVSKQPCLFSSLLSFPSSLLPKALKAQAGPHFPRACGVSGGMWGRTAGCPHARASPPSSRPARSPSLLRGFSPTRAPQRQAAVALAEPAANAGSRCRGSSAGCPQRPGG